MQKGRNNEGGCMDKIKIYNKLRQQVGKIVDGEVQVYAPDLKKAMKGYDEEEHDLIEFLKSRGFRFE